LIRQKGRRRAGERDTAVLGMKPFGGGRITDAGLCLGFLKGYADLFPCTGIESAEEMAQNISVWKENGGLTEADRREMARIKVALGSRFDGELSGQRI